MNPKDPGAREAHVFGAKAVDFRRNPKPEELEEILESVLFAEADLARSSSPYCSQRPISRAI